MALGFTPTPTLTEEELSKEKDESALAALIKERRGYEQRLTAAKNAANSAEVSKLEARVAAVDSELGTLGEYASPRSKIRK